MSPLRRLSAGCATVLLASGLVVAPFLTGPATAAELIQDGGFEAATGNPANSPNWTEADSVDGSPLCLPDSCSATSSTSPPRSGSAWARFGASTLSSHTASLSQTVTIPVGTAVLTYWYRNGLVTTPFTATLQVRVDGTTVKTHTEASTAQSSYSQQTVNLSAYANGASHTISFNYANNATGENRMTVDDVSLTYTAPPVTGTPTVSSTSPASPSNSTTPLVKGSAESGSTVTLYSNNTCTSAALGTGSATTFAVSGITATVPANATTTIFAKATKSGQTASACSTSSVAYVNDSTPPAMATLTSVTPTSPGSSTTPVVKGSAEAGSTVRLYPTAGCTGTPSATGSAAAFASPGLTVTVASGSTTTFKATATDAAGNVSACSTSSLTYVNDSAAPAQVVLTSVTPSSPSTTPVVQGTAEAGSTVKLYATAGCTGTPLATGTAAAFAAPGLTATVVLGSTTTFRATATDAAGNTSVCSTSSLTYTSDLLDGGFEAATGDPADSPFWTEADSLAGSPLCTVATCTPGAEIAPHTGNAWAWFGGFAAAGHTGSLSQLMTLPIGSVALTYWYRNSSVTPPFDAVLLVQVDGTTVKTHTEASVAEGAYSKQVVDLSSFADGASHLLSFSYVNGGEGVNNMLLDDVGLSPGAAPHTATPTVTATTPASPSTSTTPKVMGTAEVASTVTLYSNSTCTSGALGTGSAAEFAAAGITATVPAQTATTTIYAKAVKAGQNDSACSTTFVAYSHLGAPETTLVKTPKKTVSTRKRKHKVAFVFASATAGATFECSIDGKAFKACTSGHKFKLKVGKHTFAVRAVAYGLTDPTPATYSFRIKRKR
jgi:hypothetical protein